MRPCIATWKLLRASCPGSNGNSSSDQTKPPHPRYFGTACSTDYTAAALCQHTGIVTFPNILVLLSPSNNGWQRWSRRLVPNITCAPAHTSIWLHAASHPILYISDITIVLRIKRSCRKQLGKFGLASSSHEAQQHRTGATVRVGCVWCCSAGGETVQLF
jgi:hypothetical protein